MDEIPGVHIMDKADITNEQVQGNIINFLMGHEVNVVMRSVHRTTALTNICRLCIRHYLLNLLSYYQALIYSYSNNK